MILHLLSSSASSAMAGGIDRDFDKAKQFRETMKNVRKKERP
jgi:hypothetical protein